MSLAAYTRQSYIPSYADFEPNGGENGGSCFVLRGQSSGAPTILRPRITPIQESDMSVSISATVNTLNNNASNNGYEGLAPTMELLRITDNNAQVLWTNNLIGTARPDLWIAEKRDWHKLTWTTEIPQVGADLLNIGIVNKCPSGYAKIGNVSLTNHYARHYSSITVDGNPTGSSGTQITLNSRTESVRLSGPGWDTITQYIAISQNRTWSEAYLDTIPCIISRGDHVTQSVTAALGAVHNTIDGLNRMPMKYGIMLKLRARAGHYVYKEFEPIVSDQTRSVDNNYIRSLSWTADEDYTQIEPIAYVFVSNNGEAIADGDNSKFRNYMFHKGINVEIAVRKSLIGSP